jgi:enoyl-CoA hydratase/carnithine racemase
MGDSRLLLTIDRKIATICLNNPPKRNALDLVMRRELIEVLGRVRDDDQVKVVILGGAGGHFCGGSDVGSMEGIESGAWWTWKSQSSPG